MFLNIFNKSIVTVQANADNDMQLISVLLWKASNISPLIETESQFSLEMFLNICNTSIETVQANADNDIIL
jgi:hypothetical protein